MQNDVIMAGFGGQGILLIGKMLAYSGMHAGKEVSWLPSYGPEMRGGTCNCTVVISDKPVGSPVIRSPRAVVAMNLPSLEKFEADAKVRHAQLLVGQRKYAEALPLLRRAQELKPREDVQKFLEQVERFAKSRS